MITREIIEARLAGNPRTECADCGCEEYCIDYLRDAARELIERDGVTVELFPAAISAFLRAGDAAPPHPWWEGVPLPEPDATPPDPDPLRQEAARYTVARDVRRGL